MTEKEKTLELVIKHFMVRASQEHWAAIEVAGLGAHVSTIDRAVREHLKKSKDRLFGHDDLKRAIAMTLKGASKEVAEEVLAVAVKHYSWIWPVEKLTEYLCRKPTEEEIFSLVEAERTYTAVLAKDYHDQLVKFAGKYLSCGKVRKIKEILDGKTREFNSHSD